MTSLTARAFAGVTTQLAVMAVILFASAWSLTFWEGWVYWSVFSVCVVAITAYLLVYDPKLLERRLDAGPKAEREPAQKVIQAVASFFVVAIIVMPGIDRRFGWSRLPPYAVVVGNVMVILGFLLVFLVFRRNSFTSAIITVESDQPVISDGPYAVVRHPMYTGALLLFLGTPIALRSAWGLLLFLPMFGLIVQRALAEEAYLSRNLAGYEDYLRKVRWRLVPGLF